ncbi:MAG: hydroxymethylbilane synthase [Pedosphaera sp.]|nr:hydroxymethylbilane synthase [Pedosphaera sp.]
MIQRSPIRIGTRGSALALAQAHSVMAAARAAFAGREFEIKVIKTTGDRLQTAALTEGKMLPRGLFTKELEEALFNQEVDIAVHSLKDLPTDLPEGLELGGVGPRADVREVLVYRDLAEMSARVEPQAEWRPGSRPVRGFRADLRWATLPSGAVIATSSNRRAAQAMALRPDCRVVPIRGNVGSRLQKLWDQLEIDATLLAMAGLLRLNYDIGPGGRLRVNPRLPPARRAEIVGPPEGLLATLIEPEEMLPAVGQGAVGMEVRAGDSLAVDVCAALDHFNTRQSVLAERAFLKAMGGGCQSPVAGYARVVGHQLQLRAAAFLEGRVRCAEDRRPVRRAEELGNAVAAKLL